MKAYRRIITYGILISEIEVIIWKYVQDREVLFLCNKIRKGRT